jgi:hypothetical protein
MKELTKKINSFVELAKSQLKSGVVKKGDYTIIVFAQNPMTKGRNISFVYKDIDNFVKKAPKNCKSLGNGVDVNFELWSFD